MNISAGTLVSSASILFVIFVQTAGVAYWMGLLSARVRSNTARIKDLEDTEQNDGVSHASLREAFARFEGAVTAKLEHLDGRVGDLATSLSQLPAPPCRPGLSGRRRTGSAGD